MRVSSFSDIEKVFNDRVNRMVWCTVATVDGSGRPRSRILHPIWEGATGWIATGRQTLKSKHLAKTPYVSLSYWDPDQEQVYADCKTEWEDDPAEKQRIWDLLNNTPPPMGYDPGLFWKGTDDPGYGVLKLIPWRVELFSLADMASGKQPTVWKP